MAISDISLTTGMRSNLVSLQQTTNLLDRTQTRLSTGKRVNSAIDDPINFFAAQGLMNRAGDLAARKDEMGEGIQTLKAADAGVTAITSLLSQAKSIATSALSGSTGDYSTLKSQFNTVMAQIDTLASDSGYKGKNLINNDSLTINFNEDASSKLTVTGFSAKTGGTVVTVSNATTWTAASDVQGDIDKITTSLSNLRSEAKKLSSSVSIVSSRQEFTQSMIDTLKTGADNLTLADMNEEGANMLMLQTRQQLGVTSLSLASQAAQSVLRLF